MKLTNACDSDMVDKDVHGYMPFNTLLTRSVTSVIIVYYV